MEDEIPILDDQNQSQTLTVKATASSAVPKPEVKDQGKEELEKLLAGDVSETVILEDLKKASAVSASNSDEDKSYDFSKMTDQVISDSGVRLKDPVLVKRLALLIKSYIRRVRTLSGVKEYLSKEVKVGGVGVKPEKVDSIVSVIEKLKPKSFELSRADGVATLDSTSVFTTPVIKAPEIKKEEMEGKLKEEQEMKESEAKGRFSKFFKRKKEGEPHYKQGEELKKIESEIGKEIEDEISKQMKGEFTPPKSEISHDKLESKDHELINTKDAVIPMTSDGVVPKKENKSAEDRKDIPVKGIGKESDSELSHFDKSQKKESPKKEEPKVSKQKERSSRRLTGPIDALRYSIENFRRIAKNPFDRIKKIQSQVDLLEEESFSNKYLGIDAWMNSEVIQMYISIGEKSLHERMTVDESITALKSKGEVLDKDEFDSIAQLNAELRK